MKQVLSEVEKSHGSQVMHNLEALWQGIVAENRELKQALELVVTALASSISLLPHHLRNLLLSFRLTLYF